MATKNIIDMPPSSYRPSPPSSRPPPRDVTLRSAPEPPAPAEVSEMAAKKKRKRLSPSDMSVALARVEKLIGAGNGASRALATVAGEFGVSASSIARHRQLAAKNGARKPTGAPRPTDAAELGPLDIALDLLELASRARAGLGEASRKRLIAELTRRLS